MDLIDLPSLGQKVNKFSETIGPGYYPYIYIGFFLFLILLVNWSHVSSFFKSQPAKIEEGPKQPTVQTPKETEPASAIKTTGGKGNIIEGNISFGPGAVLEAENEEGLIAAGNVRVDSSTKIVERDVWLLDAVFYVAEGRWQSPNMLARHVSDIEDPKFMAKVEPAHREILQKAYDGDLLIWGRRADQSHGPYVEIDSKYWENHELEYWNMAKGNFEELETSPIGIATGPIYKELKTSRNKVEELRPKQDPGLTHSLSEVKRYWSIRNALEWWAQPQSRDFKRDGMQFFDTLEQLALDGDITVWGRPNALHHPWEQIDPSYWKDYRFDTSRYIHLDSEEKIRDTKTHPKITARVGNVEYYDLRLNSTEVMGQWPVEST